MTRQQELRDKIWRDFYEYANEQIKAFDDQAAQFINEYVMQFDEVDANWIGLEFLATRVIYNYANLEEDRVLSFLPIFEKQIWNAVDDQLLGGELKKQWPSKEDMKSEKKMRKQ